MDKILSNGGILALIGVVVGFLLSELSSSYKRCVERSDAKKSLLDEVRFNHEQTKNKIDILEQALAALKNQKFLSTPCGKYSTSEFEHLYHVSLPKLSKSEKDNYRHLNSFYITIDDLLASFDSSFKNDLDNIEARQTSFESVYEAGILKMSDIKESLETSLTLSSGLLNGKPIQIFARNDV